MIKELSTALTGVKHEQEYMQVRIQIISTFKAGSFIRLIGWFQEGQICRVNRNRIMILINQLSLSIFQVRDRIHRAINENTNSRVVMWSFFEALVLVAMTLGQIYYLKRFFEVRRVV